MPDSPVGPPDASLNPRYAGIATFARLPRREDVGRADIAVVGVPFDTGVSYRPGARFGPAQIREASRLLRPYNPAQDVSPFSSQQVVDAGDIVANPFSIDEAVKQIQDAAAELGSDGTRLVTLGGDHTIALPLLRAVAKKHGPVAVLHFDAHLDTWDTYFGAPITHGTPFRRASEEGLIDLTASTHVGTRGPLYSPVDLEDDSRLGFAIISSTDIEDHGLPRAIERMLARLGDRPVYLSIDIDVLDPRTRRERERRRREASRAGSCSP
jgi:agmatinase